MRNLWLVVKREYVSRARSSAYIITTLFMMILFLGSTLVPAIVASRSKTEALHILLLDRTGQVAVPLQAALNAAAIASGSRSVALEVVEGDEAALTDRARTGSVALLVVEGGYPDGVKARYLSGSPNVMMGSSAVLIHLESVVRSALMQKQGIDPAVLAQLMRPIAVEQRQLGTHEGERDEEQFKGSLMLALGAVMAIYIIVLLNGSFVFQGVLEEKLSRVMEVMAASVRPSEMMTGKVLGLGGLGLTQFILLGVSWGLGSKLAGSMTGIPAVSPGAGLGALMITYMILGYALSATLMAAAASTISRMEDSTTVMMPITMLQVIPMMMFGVILGDPNGMLSTVLSMVPFFSPTVMMLRLVLASVPAWQVIVSLGLMVASTVLMAWGAGRVYRAAMLSYGGRPSMRQIWSYLRVG